MSIRAKLILVTALLQLGSLALLSGGLVVVFSTYGERLMSRSEDLLRQSVARTALDALIQKDEVQLLSYLNYLKGQYPSLTYARVTWRRGDRATTRTVGQPSSSASLVERRVAVEDPKQPGTQVEVSYGVDLDVLEEPFVESRRRIYKMILAVGLATGAAGVLVSFLLARRMTVPLDELGTLAQEIGSGKLGARLDWRSEDEIGVLVRAFNAMSERLEELDAVKRTFVSSVTHELRSPLGAIESFLPLIEERLGSSAGAPPQVREYLGRIQGNVARLSAFIDDLLTVARIEQGKMECVLKPTSLAPVVDEVVQLFRPKAESQSVALASALGSPPAVLADAERVRQVLVNLVSNALKFTPPGGRVSISSDQYREGADRWLEVTVADTGAGMAPAEAERLFRPFAQGANVVNAIGRRGTGLGLYIVKSIVEQHGGKVGIESAPGRGTRVRFSLRFAA